MQIAINTTSGFKNHSGKPLAKKVNDFCELVFYLFLVR